MPKDGGKVLVAMNMDKGPDAGKVAFLMGWGKRSSPVELTGCCVTERSDGTSVAVVSGSNEARLPSSTAAQLRSRSSSDVPPSVDVDGCGGDITTPSGGVECELPAAACWSRQASAPPALFVLAFKRSCRFLSPMIIVSYEVGTCLTCVTHDTDAAQARSRLVFSQPHPGQCPERLELEGAWLVSGVCEAYCRCET